MSQKYFFVEVFPTNERKHFLRGFILLMSLLFTAPAWYQKDFNEMRIIFAFWHFSLFAKMFKNVFSCFQNCQFYYSELSKVVLTAKAQDNWNVSILIVKYFLWSNKYYLDVCSEIRLDWHTISLSQVHLPLPIPPPPNTQSWWGSYSIGVVLTTYHSIHYWTGLLKKLK